MKFWSRWVSLLDRREEATALAASRIIAGFTLGHHLVATWASGAWRAVWVDVQFGGIRSVDHGVLDWIGGATPFHVRAFMAMGIASSVLMVGGAWTRAACVLAWFSFRTLSLLNDHSGGSSDDLLISVLFLLMFSGCGRALSLDGPGRTGGETPAWPRYLLVGQMVLMYFTTGLQKVSAGWLPFGPMDALWYILQQPTWHRIDMRWLWPLFPLTQLGSAVTWLFELGAPLLLLAFWYRLTRERPGKARTWFNRVDFRTKFLLVGLALHLGIFLTMEVGPFLGTMLALYAACFSPAEWKRAIARLRDRRARDEQVHVA